MGQVVRDKVIITFSVSRTRQISTEGRPFCLTSCAEVAFTDLCGFGYADVTRGAGAFILYSLSRVLSTRFTNWCTSAKTSEITFSVSWPTIVWYDDFRPGSVLPQHSNDVGAQRDTLITGCDYVTCTGLLPWPGLMEISRWSNVYFDEFVNGMRIHCMLVLVVTARDVVYYSYGTGNLWFDHVEGSLLFRLASIVIDNLKYSGLSRSTHRMGTDPALTAMGILVWFEAD